MSGIVDMWTSEVARLREKGRTIFSSGSSPSTLESSQQQVVRAEKESLTRSFPGLTRLTGVNSPVLLYSEASVNMLVECFSP
ncbi:hypothetical protein L1049_019885 [Liquidambar formosana]|uniref:Uncharacterized protein n=1 Tax=Liquidambar formosana TaxID=63359 RepID=A0AAP0S6D6_LIQFO